MAIAALLVGLLVTLQGVVGLLAPASFHELISAIQVPPFIYAAAVARVAIGVVLMRAARHSRFPTVLRFIGLVIAIGGVLTPFLGQPFAQVVLGWWSQSVAVVRGFALFSLVLGTFICYAMAQRSRVPG